MKVGDYYVMTRQLRTDGTFEIAPRDERATPDREQAMREARGNAHRLKGDGRQSTRWSGSAKPAGGRSS